MNVDKYKSSQRLERVFGVVRILFGHTVHGLAPGEIAKAIQASPAIVTRMLANLKQIGMVEEIRDSGRWRLGPMLVQGATAHALSIDRAEHELREVKQRYSRDPK